MGTTRCRDRFSRREHGIGEAMRHTRWYRGRHKAYTDDISDVFTRFYKVILGSARNFRLRPMCSKGIPPRGVAGLSTETIAPGTPTAEGIGG
jgi:hypothetical protein